MSVKKNRDIWIDNCKVFAISAVVICHFFESMMKADLVSDSFLYEWFEHTARFYAVNLFFICSGFLYQKYSKVNSVATWVNNIKKKFIAFGVPYFVFSFATWILKTAFSSSVNTKVDGLGYILFVHPTAPYWYLYTLLFIFMITVTVENKKQMYILLAIAFAAKIIRFCGLETGLYFIDRTLDNWVWFVIGMAIAKDVIKLVNAVFGYIILALLLVSSVYIEMYLSGNTKVAFAAGLVLCYAIASILHSIFSNGEQNKVFAVIAKYSMPIFLMHTLFAATFRIVLFKVGIDNAVLHIILGLVVTFVGPITGMIVMEKIRPLDFIVYPTRYIKLKKKEY